jgi:F-type H+-transporting ATPase subunit delta
MASVASLYARAFADVVYDPKLESTKEIEDLRAIEALFQESVELRKVWENPAIPADQKRHLLDAIVQRDGIGERVRNLIAVLIDNRRTHFLPQIIEQFEKEMDRRWGYVEADVTTVRKLGDAEKSLLEQKVKDLTGVKKVRATYEQDASVLGGVVVRVGSTIYDGSVRGRLEKIREAISS